MFFGIKVNGILLLWALFILKIVDWMLGSHFRLNNIWIALLVAILLSIINFIIGEILIKPIIKGVKRIWKK